MQASDIWWRKLLPRTNIAPKACYITALGPKYSVPRALSEFVVTRAMMERWYDVHFLQENTEKGFHGLKRQPRDADLQVLRDSTG
jgi:hypothetical protein